MQGLYRGLVPTIEGIIVYRACFFGTFDTAKALLFEDPERPPFWKNWLLSQVIAQHDPRPFPLR